MREKVEPIRCRFSDKGLKTFRSTTVKGIKSKDRLGYIIKKHRREQWYWVIWDGTTFGDWYHQDFIEQIDLIIEKTDDETV